MHRQAEPSAEIRWLRGSRRLLARPGAAIVVASLVTGCPRDDANRAPHGERSSPSGTARAELPTAPPTDTAGWVGTWTSAPCGQRPYSRQLVLESKGVASAHDLVSPCPPDVACVWSGVISFKGTWKLKDERVVLELERETYPNMKAAPLPTELSWSSGPVGVEDGERCTYRPQ